MNQEKITRLLLDSVDDRLMETTRTEEIIISLIKKNDSFDILPVQEFRDIVDSAVRTLQTTKIVNIEKIQFALSVFLMFAVAILKALWMGLPRRCMPWLALTMATFSSTVIGLMIGTPADKIIIDAFMVSTSAGGLWSLIGKYVCRLWEIINKFKGF